MDNMEEALDMEIRWSANKILWEPIYHDFAEERALWYDKNHKNMTSEEEKALENASDEEIRDYFFEKFEENWRNVHTSEECAALDDIMARYEEAAPETNRLLEHGEEYQNLLAEHLNAELEKFENHGIIILGKGDSEGWYALIPIDQLRNFPENVHYGYRVIWFSDEIKDSDTWVGLLKEHGLEGLLENTRSFL